VGGSSQLRITESRSRTQLFYISKIIASRDFAPFQLGEMIHPNLVVKNSHSSFDILLGLAPITIKNPIKTQWLEPSHGQEKGKSKKGQKEAKLVGTKEGRELVPLVVWNYFTHNPFNVKCM